MKKKKRNTKYLADGYISIHPKGFAFVEVPQGVASERIFISRKEVNNAWNGDFVGIRIKPKSKGESREGKVVKILERKMTNVVGTFYENEANGFVIPDEKWLEEEIYISKKCKNGARNGDKVIVKMRTYPDKTKYASGEIFAILGHQDQPGVDILSVVYRKGIDVSFPIEVQREADGVQEEIQEKEKIGRRDLRKELIVTIDGEDAKDLDDAVNVKILENGNYLLGVHIADVSHYVSENTFLDEEARDRATSVYLVDRVIPMLPKKLSNGICSLNPNVDRLTLSCEMEINQEGEVINYEIFPSIVHSKERMTYSNVNKILLEQDEETRKAYSHLLEMFEDMKDLQEILYKKREKRGSIDFDLPEAKIKLDEKGKPVDIFLRERRLSEKMIEEFMLVANETVAKCLEDLELPGMYRIHEDPKEGRVADFYSFLNSLGYNQTGNEIQPKTYQKLLREVAGKKEEKAVSSIMLRSMQQAKYKEEPVGHFGLATKHYTHFTSPIRRYPDLIVHRLLRTYLFQKDKSKKTVEKWKGKIPLIAEHASKMERRAIEIEREVESMKKVEFMEDKIGQEFVGTINGVMKFGMFVELQTTVEGLVPIETIKGDRFELNEEQFCLVGEKTGKVFRIGDEVKVKVTKLDKEKSTIDFELL